MKLVLIYNGNLVTKVKIKGLERGVREVYWKGVSWPQVSV